MIKYNLNPRGNELLAAMIGNYQDGSIPYNDAVEYFGMGADLEEGV